MYKEEVLEKALETYGDEMQMIVCIEEMSELIKELCKLLRKKGNIDHIAEEIADVEITTMEMKKLFNITNRVQGYLTYKVDRLEKELNHRKE